MISPPIQQLRIFNSVVPKEVLYKVQIHLSGPANTLVKGLKEELKIRGFNSTYLYSEPHITLFYFKGFERWQDELAMQLLESANKEKPMLIRMSGLDTFESNGTLFVKVKNKHEVMRLNHTLCNDTRIHLISQYGSDLPIQQSKEAHVTIVSGLKPTEMEIAQKVLSIKGIECAFQAHSIKLIKFDPAKRRNELINEISLRG